MTLNNFMKEAFYRDYLRIVEEKLSQRIDMESEYYELNLKSDMEYLKMAKMALTDLKWLIENHREETALYIAKKIEMYLDPDGGENEIVNYPPMIDFPILHLIEYFLILKNPESLVEYIQSIRIPGAKKYVKEIKKIFDDVQHV